jgi:hypothetical protein
MPNETEELGGKRHALSWQPQGMCSARWQHGDPGSHLVWKLCNDVRHNPIVAHAERCYRATDWQWRILTNMDANDRLCEQCNSYMVEEGKLMILEEGGPISSETRNRPSTGEEDNYNSRIIYWDSSVSKG